MNHIQASWVLKELGYTISLKEKNGEPFWIVSRDYEFIAHYTNADSLIKMCNRVSKRRRRDTQGSRFNISPLRGGHYALSL